MSEEDHFQTTLYSPHSLKTTLSRNALFPDICIKRISYQGNVEKNPQDLNSLFQKHHTQNLCFFMYVSFSYLVTRSCACNSQGNCSSVTHVTVEMLDQHSGVVQALFWITENRKAISRLPKIPNE